MVTPSPWDEGSIIHTLTFCQLSRRDLIFWASSQKIARLFKSSEGRVEAAIALGEIAKKPSITALKAAMNDQDYSVSYHARKSLAVLLCVQEKYEALQQIIMTGASYEQQEARKEQHRLIENVFDNYEK